MAAKNATAMPPMPTVTQADEDEFVIQPKVYVNPTGDFTLLLKGAKTVHGQYGESISLDFVIEDEGEFHDAEISLLASKSLSAKSKLGRVATALLGRPLRWGKEALDVRSMIGNGRLRARLEEHQLADGRIFSRIDTDRLLPAN